MCTHARQDKTFGKGHPSISASVLVESPSARSVDAVATDKQGLGLKDCAIQNAGPTAVTDNLGPA